MFCFSVKLKSVEALQTQSTLQEKSFIRVLMFRQDLSPKRCDLSFCLKLQITYNRYCCNAEPPILLRRIRSRGLSKLGDVVEWIALFKTWLSPVWDSGSKQDTQEFFLLRSVSFSPAPVLGSRKLFEYLKWFILGASILYRCSGLIFLCRRFSLHNLFCVLKWSRTPAS